MHTYKNIFADGDYLVTRFNGDADAARAYYLGRLFNIGTAADRLVKCVKVEQIDEEGKQ